MLNGEFVEMEEEILTIVTYAELNNHRFRSAICYEIKFIRLIFYCSVGEANEAKH